MTVSPVPPPDEHQTSWWEWIYLAIAFTVGGLIVYLLLRLCE